MEQAHIRQEIAKHTPDFGLNPKWALTQLEHLLLGSSGPAIISYPNLPLPMLDGYDRCTINRIRSDARYPFLVIVNGKFVSLQVILKYLAIDQVFYPHWKVTFRIVSACDWMTKEEVPIPPNIFGIISRKLEHARELLTKSFENMYYEACAA